MSGRNPRMVQRDRSKLQLKILHIEITTESYEFLKQIAAAKQMPMGGYIDVLIRKNKVKAEALYKASILL
jgi:hypothetical protein